MPHPVGGCSTQLFDEGRVVLDKDLGDGGEEALHEDPQPGSFDAGFAADFTHQRGCAGSPSAARLVDPAVRDSGPGWTVQVAAA